VIGHAGSAETQHFDVRRRNEPGGGNRVFLDVAGFQTGVLDASGGEFAVEELSGKTLGRVFAQMCEALRVAGEETPDAGDLPRLAGGGRWHTEGFTAAVLRGSELVSAGGGA